MDIDGKRPNTKDRECTKQFNAKERERHQRAHHQSPHLLRTNHLLFALPHS
jgi:hypothetical protein